MAERHIPAIGNQVLVSGKKKVGMVSALLTDVQVQEPTAFVVKYGLLHKKTKRVTLTQIKWINAENVVLELTDRQFAALPEWQGADVAAEPDASPGPTPA